MTEAEALAILYGTPEPPAAEPVGKIRHRPPPPSPMPRYWSDRFDGACAGCKRQYRIAKPQAPIDTCMTSCERCGRPIFLYRQTMSEALETK